MLENLKEVILNLEKSLNALVQDEEVELLEHPEYLQAMKEVVQSINQVTQTLKKLEESYSEGRELDTKKRVEREKTSKPDDRILKVIRKKTDDRRASSN
jgi:hypothetical protein